MIIAKLKISVPPNKRRSAIETIRAIIGWTSAQAGCINIAFYQDTDNPDSMILLEEWEDWGSMEKHIRSDSYWNILELMELSSEQPEIKFSKVSSTKGMEFLEKLRG